MIFGFQIFFFRENGTYVLEGNRCWPIGVNIAIDSGGQDELFDHLLRRLVEAATDLTKG